MIYVRLYGGMGNQMFQYAFCKKLQKIYQQPISMDVSLGTEHASINGDSLGDFAFKSFNMQKSNIYYKDHKKFMLCAGKMMNLAIFLEMVPRAVRKIIHSEKIYIMLEKKLQSWGNKRGLYTTFDCYVEPVFSNNKKDLYVSGLFTNKMYFDDIRNDLKRDFAPICAINEENRKYLDMIRELNSVCIHVRKGNSYTSSRILDVCTSDYFNKAIAILENKVKTLVYFVFSNDIEWCKKNLEYKNRKIIFVDVNDSNHPVEELRLMMNCRHFILSNSTMSWWAQYLAENKGYVISPSRWSNTDKNLLKDLIDSSWILVEV